MKLIRQTSLEFREGTSDKVYEVDLCEVAPGRHAVNFRFGRRGARLQEGSKTPLPVVPAEAERLFDKLVAEKVAKGYLPAGTSPGVSAPLAGARVEDLEDPRHRRIVAILAAGGQGGWTSDLDRLIWRAGELRVRAAAPHVAALATGATDLRAWNVARALLRCGDPALVPAVRALASTQRPPWVRSMAAHALAVLLEGEEREAFLREAEAALPESVRRGLEAGRPPLADTAAVLERVYLIARYRPQVLALVAEIPLRDPGFVGIRRVWKAAEALGDGEIWGLLTRRFDLEPANPERRRGRDRTAYTRGTRTWARLRAWRTLRRLGEADLASEYCRLAVGVLLAHEVPLVVSRRSTGADPRWAYHHVLHGEASGWVFSRKHRTARPPVEPIVRPPSVVQLIVRPPSVVQFRSSGREEAFPRLWDAEPEALGVLLDRSGLEEVHRFAARALRANPATWGRISVAQLMGWFDRPFADTVQLAADLAVTRYDPNDPDLQLVLALLSSPNAGARATAETWVRRDPAPFLRSAGFVVGLVLSPAVETRRLALELLGSTTLLPAQARQVVDAVLTAAVRTTVEDAEATPRLRDAAAVLLAAFSRELSETPLERVAELVRHPAAGVAELGVKILLGHRIRPAELPDDLLAAAMTSEHPVVRGIGVRLYGELPDAVLAERFRVLVHLVTNPYADVRHAVTPIIVRLAGNNRAFARVLLGALVPALGAEGPEGVHRDVVRLLRTDLAGVLPLVEPGQVFRLLRAPETVVQELGGELLRTNVDPGALVPSQLAILASSDVLGVRRTAWAMLSARVDDVRRDPESVLPLLDARWADSRERAFAFVENEVGLEHLGPEVALAVCDSVRPEVQAFGRRLVVSRFEHADGLRYLLRLAQHPSPDMQAFAASWLEAHAAGDPERIARFVPFFTSVATRPNRGRVAKVRVLAFLETQLADPGCAAVIAPLLSELVLTVASSHRARYVTMLAEIRRLHPEIPNPLRVVEPEVRGAV